MSITKHELKGKARFEDDYHTFHLKSLPEGVAAPNGAYYLGKQGIDGHRYRLGHPLAQHVLNRAAISPHFPSIVDIQCGEKAILL